MTHIIDIRDQVHLSGSDVQKLNFIKDSGQYVFRKFYRSGLRSHIFEILTQKDIDKETCGEIIDSIRMYPRAKPQKMFRILRNRFQDIPAVFHEIQKYTILLNALGPEFIAQSDEFIVDYTGTGKNQIVLCGLQEYVEGEILDPWRLSGKDYLYHVFNSMPKTDLEPGVFVRKAKENITGFVQKIREMILETHFIPDLAGIGNLILTASGDLKLVDINNIVKIQFNDTILIDDKGYPSCDVSVDVLSILEQEILEKKSDAADPLYRIFLAPERKKKVKALEKKFYQKGICQSSQ